MRKWMKSLTIGLALTVGLSCIVSVGAVQAASKIGWQSYDAGMAKAKKENKKILLYFRADWCQYCTVMDRDVFSNPSVMREIHKNYVPIRVDADKEKILATQYKVQGLPTTWFLTQNAEPIGGIPGSFPPEVMTHVLTYISSDSYKQMQFEEFMKRKGL